MFKALRHPPIAKLWAGQAFSSIGDEIYRVGLTWLAVGLIGENTGYLSAGQAASLMLLSFIGGKWADRWEPLATMINVDFVRALIILIPVITSYFMPTSLSLLWVVALVLSALGAFFDPALQTCLPRYSPDVETLRSATGLMSTTTRLARMVGPAIVGFLSGIVPPIHFFTMDAVTFACSALSVRMLKNYPARTESSAAEAGLVTGHTEQTLGPKKKISLSEALVSGFRAVRRKKGMTYMMASRALTGGPWNLAYGLGFALLVQELSPHNTKMFGMVIASYGIGNFSGAVYFGNGERLRPTHMMYLGYVLLGLGFVCVGLSPNIFWIVISSIYTGFCGPMNDITFSDVVQARFHLSEMTKIFRLRMAIETAATLFCMLAAPVLFRFMGVRNVIALCGIVWVLVGAAGLYYYPEQKKRTGPSSGPPKEAATLAQVSAASNDNARA